MRITNVEVFVFDTKTTNWRPIGCRIHTDEGVFGDGEAALSYGNGAGGVFGAIQDFASSIIGMNPLEHEVIWEMLYKTSFWGQNGGPLIFAAISAIDIALWDIKGKYLKQPVYMLLGGKKRDTLRAYASQLQFGWRDASQLNFGCVYKTEDYVAEAKKAVAEGYDCIKVDFFTFDRDGRMFTLNDHTGFLTEPVLDLIEERVAAVREAIGPHVDIIVENHSYPDAQGAIRIAKRIEKYNIFAFEEPNTPTPQTSRMLREKINIPLANGERIYTRWQYLPYFVDNSIQLIQPDLGTCGGITEAKKICDLAHIFDVGVQGHACASPFSTDVALHLEAAIPNFVIHEHHCVNRLGMNQGMTKYNRHPVNGVISPSDEPGFGNEFLQEAIDKAKQYANITANVAKVPE